MPVRNASEMMQKAQDAGWTYGVGKPVCVYCGSWVGYKGKKLAGRRKLTRDHFIPRAKGGPNNFLNRVPACEPCNAAKADLDPADFVSRLGERSLLTVEHVERARRRILSTTEQPAAVCTAAPQCNPSPQARQDMRATSTVQSRAERYDHE